MPCHMGFEYGIQFKDANARPRNLRLSELFNHVQSIHHMFTLGTISLYASPETHE